MLVELANYEDRKPPDMVRRLIKQAHKQMRECEQAETKVASL